MEEEKNNTKILVFDIKIPKRVSNKTRQWNTGRVDKTILNMVVSNLISCMRREQTLVYSRHKSNPTTSRRKVSTRQVVSTVGWLEKNGYVINTIGNPSGNPEKRTISWLEPTSKLHLEFPEKGLIQKCEDNYFDALPVIELRGKDKKPINFKRTDKVNKMEEMVKRVNEVNSKSVVVTGDGEVLSNPYCRIFNEDFTKGGRWYRADITRMKNGKDKRRLDVKIDGQGIIEIDYSCLHIKILAVLAGMEWEDIEDDIYMRIIPDTEERTPTNRLIAKLTVNIMLNCTEERVAINAINKEIRSLNKEEKEEYTLGSGKSVMSLVYHSLPEFEEFFCSEEDYGMKLQNIDSEIVASVLEVFVEKGYPCLPIHDSFIVKQEHGDLLFTTMGDCWRKVMGVDWPVSVSYMFKEEDYLNEYSVVV